jgi:hypothetical protein
LKLNRNAQQITYVDGATTDQGPLFIPPSIHKISGVWLYLNPFIITENTAQFAN